MQHRICVVANPASGQNSRGDDQLKAAMAVLDGHAELRRAAPGEDIAATTRHALDDGFDTIVAAGGDGTFVSVAQILVGGKATLGVLPLGTFNYFARGMGLSEDPAEAARTILNGQRSPIAVGEVNGQVFLNNASIGIYPHILKEREATYRRFGRSRIAAYWSVIRTFINFQRPTRRTIEVEKKRLSLRTPLIFVARSAYQLEAFGLTGTAAIANDKFAVFIIRPSSGWRMFVLAFQLVRRRVKLGQDVDLVITDRLSVNGRRPSELVAYDGEKKRMRPPVTFSMRKDALTVLLPAASA